MSGILKPIHRWLFTKIKLAEERERHLENAAEKEFGEKIILLNKELEARYGKYLDEKSLDELVGESDIDAFLSETAKRIETRESYLIKTLIDMRKETAKTFIIKSSYDNGRLFGTNAVKEYNVQELSPEKLHSILKNYSLDYTNTAGSMTEYNRDVELIVKHNGCVHRTNWKNVGVDEKFMCEYLSAWIDGFVNAFKGMKHLRTKAVVRGDKACEDIYKKV